MKRTPSLLLVDAVATLFVGRRTWSSPEMRGARVWESSLAEHLHRAARLEDLARRGGPRTAREHGDQEFDRLALDATVVDAAVAAWNQHRLEAATPPPRRRRSLPKWQIAMTLHLGGDAA